MALLSPIPWFQFVDSNGSPLSGGKVYTYAAGTTTPLATYTTSVGNVANANPIILDSRGMASVWLGTALYYMELKTSADVLIRTADNIGGFISAGGAGNLAITGTLTVGGEATIHGLTVGLGAGSIGTNTVLGIDALDVNTTGANCTAIGYQALINNTTGSNTAIGSSTLSANSTGNYNTAVGNLALTNNTVGLGNTAMGYAGLFFNTTGNYNTAYGTSALYSNNVGVNNSFFGVSSGYTNTSGDSNSGFGYAVLYSLTLGFNNVGMGYEALYSTTTGSNNTALGYTALFNNTVGTYNTAIGRDALIAGTNLTNNSGLGYNTAVTGSNQVQLGNSATTTYAYGVVQDRSDARDKADIRDTVLGLDFITALRPVDFKWDMRDYYKPPMPTTGPVEEWLEAVKLDNLQHDGSKKRSRYHHGFIAQEVKEVITDTGVDFGGFQDHKIAGGQDVLSLGYGELIAPMVKAMQELKEQLDIAKADIEILKGLP